MANTVLERGLARAAEESRAGWAAPASTATASAPGAPRIAADRRAMTIGGVGSASAVLFVLVLVGGVFGWSSVESVPLGEARIPGWVLGVMLGAFAIAILTTFKPHLARFTGPVYALLEGAVLGAISRVYENQWNGIVVQAIALTVLVFATMLLLYATRIIKVTERFRRIVITATIALMVFYGISLLLSLFNVEAPLIWDAGPIGILFSVFVVGLAAFNLALDFDLAEKGAKAGLPKSYEWYCAFALMVSIVWLYLEILRLLSKLRD